MASASTENRPNQSPSSEYSIRVQVVTPERIVIDEWVKQVVVPLPDGEFGIAKNHDPIIAKLGFGTLKLIGSSGSRKFFLNGGFVQLRDNQVVILTDKAVEAGSLNVSQIEQDLQTARSQSASSDAEIDLRLLNLEKLRSRLRLAKQSK
ncbi:MAG: ATP synthase F1 subunit epsilon [Planctomycetota bacterium]|nr:MAG: ATP synthase F1 subunit epsilon [Planctomycetota bacterium]